MIFLSFNSSCESKIDDILICLALEADDNLEWIYGIMGPCLTNVGFHDNEKKKAGTARGKINNNNAALF